MDVAAVIFDLDGVLIDSEQVWDDERQAFVREAGGTWKDEATRAMMGMSDPEWSVYVRDELGVPMTDREISEAVVGRVLAHYERSLPLLPGAVDCVRALAARWTLGLASSSNRPIIDRVLDEAGIAGCFAATVSSEEVAAGKPSPDVYLEAARRLGVDPAACVAIEDSTNGIKSAHAAGMRVIAAPNEHFPPADDALALAAVVVGGVGEIDAEVVAST